MSKIYFGGSNFKELRKFFKEFQDKKILLLVDDHTNKLCLPMLIAEVPSLISAQVFEIKHGESSKNLDTCQSIWEHLSSLSFNRNDLIINLGGGVITDIGGFVASTFKRGLKYINVPTTVLGQVDAAIGGKTGVNYLHLKNLIGTINFPQAVFIHSDFINTLPLRHVASGFAEIVKTALIYDKELWMDLVAMGKIDLSKLVDLSKRTTEIKESIVTNDPTEKGLRKILNFGHTIGHALETYDLKRSDSPILHGEAVAMGIVAEAFISFRLEKISKINLDQVVELVFRHFEKISIEQSSFAALLEIMKKDKKNISNEYNFTLLEALGSASHDNIVDEKVIVDALSFILHLNS